MLNPFTTGELCKNWDKRILRTNALKTFHYCLTEFYTINPQGQKCVGHSDKSNTQILSHIQGFKLSRDFKCIWLIINSSKQQTPQQFNNKIKYNENACFNSHFLYPLTLKGKKSLYSFYLQYIKPSGSCLHAVPEEELFCL